MKTFLSILGGLGIVVLSVGTFVLASLFPKVVGVGLVGVCLVAFLAIIFRIGYTITRDVILGD